MFRLTIREEAEDSVAALSSKVEALMRRKEKLEAALAQVGPVHVNPVIRVSNGSGAVYTH